MKKVFFICFMVWGAAVFAEEGSKIELKRRSAFNEEAEARNPFWPIGWKPTAKISTSNVENAGAKIPSSAFVVSSITLDPRAHFAIINGKTIGEGQQFGLQLGNQLYQITVKAIQDGRVILLRRDQEIIVPLRRK
jgi:hypothetical protein